MTLRELTGVSGDAGSVVVDGVTIAVERTGSGPPVVCLHAVGHGGGDFRAFAERVGDAFEVIRIDWPGQGRSGDDSQPASAARYAALLDGVLAQLGVDRPVLVGNSIGGAAALIHAANHPEKVAALVLSNPGGLEPLTGFARRFIGAMVRFFRAGERGRTWFDPAFWLYYRGILRTAPARAQRRRIVRAGRETAPVLRQAWESFGQSGADIRHLATRVRCPVLFAWARRDRIVALERSRPAIARFPDARLVLFPGGHAPFLEAPDAFAATFRAFAASVRPPEAAPKLEQAG